MGKGRLLLALVGLMVVADPADCHTVLDRCHRALTEARYIVESYADCVDMTSSRIDCPIRSGIG
jgi:hypothetical protein